MSSLSFVFSRTIKNKVKRSLKRPQTYLALVFVILYAALVLYGLGSMSVDFGLNSPEGIATVLSVLMVMIVPANLISYIKRKGLLFRPSEVHFVFAAPEEPKKVILHAGMKQFLTNFIVELFILVLGIGVFGVTPYKMILYFLYAGVLENILEGALMIICYGNETLPKQFFTVLTYIMYGVMAAFALVAIYFVSVKGMQLSVFVNLIQLPVVQLIPIIGWEIALIQFIIIGPAGINVVATGLLLISTVLLVLYAKKMKCTGEFYEDAAKFAEDYDNRMKRSKKGEVVVGNGRKKYLRNVKMAYKGTYAKAIFYRQVLEYRKNRFFIFGWNSVLFLIVGVAIAVVSYYNKLSGQPFKMFVIPGVIAYVIFIFSGYKTKWSKELANPYTYLIPDSNFKKMWYATKMEHIRALVDGLLITLPGSIVMGLPVSYIIMTVILYMCLNANKLYMNMLADVVIGKMFGELGRTILRMLFQGLVLCVGIIVAVAAGVFISVTAGFIMMIVIIFLLTLVGAIGASFAFERMEALD